MTPEKIKAKALELAALYTAKANGKILEYDIKGLGWVNNGSMSGPDMQSDLSRWRVKPEPRRMWEIDGAIVTKNRHDADMLRAKGHQVTEWQEVLP